MTQKDIKALVVASYKKDQLNESAIARIAKVLSRKDLKAYIRALKLEEKKRKIYIALPSKSVYNTSKKSLEKIFKDKELVFQEDPTLLLGLKLVDNDTVYDMSLKNRLQTIQRGVSE